MKKLFNIFIAFVLLGQFFGVQSSFSTANSRVENKVETSNVKKILQSFRTRDYNSYDRGDVFLPALGGRPISVLPNYKITQVQAYLISKLHNCDTLVRMKNRVLADCSVDELLDVLKYYCFTDFDKQQLFKNSSKEITLPKVTPRELLLYKRQNFTGAKKETMPSDSELMGIILSKKMAAQPPTVSKEELSDISRIENVSKEATASYDNLQRMTQKIRDHFKRNETVDSTLKKYLLGIIQTVYNKDITQKNITEILTSNRLLQSIDSRITEALKQIIRYGQRTKTECKKAPVNEMAIMQILSKYSQLHKKDLQQNKVSFYFTKKNELRKSLAGQIKQYMSTHTFTLRAAKALLNYVACYEFTQRHDDLVFRGNGSLGYLKSTVCALQRIRKKLEKFNGLVDFYSQQLYSKYDDRHSPAKLIVQKLDEIFQNRTNNNDHNFYKNLERGIDELWENIGKLCQPKLSAMLNNKVESIIDSNSKAAQKISSLKSFFTSGMGKYIDMLPEKFEALDPMVMYKTAYCLLEYAQLSTARNCQHILEDLKELQYFFEKGEHDQEIKEGAIRSVQKFITTFLSDFNPNNIMQKNAASGFMWELEVLRLYKENQISKSALGSLLAMSKTVNDREIDMITQTAFIECKNRNCNDLDTNDLAKFKRQIGAQLQRARTIGKNAVIVLFKAKQLKNSAFYKTMLEVAQNYAHQGIKLVFLEKAQLNNEYINQVMRSSDMFFWFETRGTTPVRSTGSYSRNNTYNTGHGNNRQRNTNQPTYVARGRGRGRGNIRTSSGYRNQPSQYTRDNRGRGGSYSQPRQYSNQRREYNTSRGYTNSRRYN